MVSFLPLGRSLSLAQRCSAFFWNLFPRSNNGVTNACCRINFTNNCNAICVATIHSTSSIHFKMDQDLEQLVQMLTYIGKPLKRRLLVKSANVVDTSR